jgi:hypothetical protein
MSIRKYINDLVNYPNQPREFMKPYPKTNQVLGIIGVDDSGNLKHSFEIRYASANYKQSL